MRNLLTDVTLKILWYIGRPKHGVGELYEQVIRDAAGVTGLGVWYVRYVVSQLLANLDTPFYTCLRAIVSFRRLFKHRSLTHNTTSIGGAVVRDDDHVTVFADAQAGGDASEMFNFEGHLYVVRYLDGSPWRLLHPDEFEFGDPPAPVVLYDASQIRYPYYMGDEYYNYHENATYGETEETEAVQPEDTQPEATQSETTQSEAAEGASQGKAKRKRRPKKGKGKQSSS